VRIVTTAGLGMMFTMHRRMQRHQGKGIFCNLQESMEDVFRISHLITALQVAPDVPSALAALQKDTV
jgi:anti-anti-sigma regulatory factor